MASEIDPIEELQSHLDEAKVKHSYYMGLMLEQDTEMRKIEHVLSKLTGDNNFIEKYSVFVLTDRINGGIVKVCETRDVANKMTNARLKMTQTPVYGE